jgi:hypothetical protein
MIPLECGDPGQRPASYTRFVLPFAYRPEKYERHHATRVYKPAAPVSLWRRNYVTVETAAVLFERARWFELHGATSLSFRIQRGERSVTVGMKPPRLVLFEWPAHPGNVSNTEPADLLRLGFLIVETYFPNKTEAVGLDDLLAFNELFRYWQRPYKGHEEQRYKHLLASCPVDMLHPVMRIGWESSSAIYTERWASLLRPPIEDKDGTLWRLMPAKWDRDAQTWMATPEHIWESGWIVYTDHRAFVWTCAILKGGGRTLADYFKVSNVSLEADAFGHWIKLLNVDPPEETPEKTHEMVTTFERAWVAERTYGRWQEHGTFYGFNYHCGAMLGAPLRIPPTWQHFAEMYFDQTLLLLYLRVGSFRFSQRLSRLSARARDRTALDNRTGFETWRQTFEKLRGDFALFTNLYQFPLLSSQQQGLEMYAMARRYMDVEALFREIQEEIRSSHEYMEIRTAREQTATSTQLTVVATVGLAVGLASSILGMNVLIDTLKGKTFGMEVILAFGILLLSVYLIFWAFKHAKSIVNFLECLQKRELKEPQGTQKPLQEG